MLFREKTGPRFRTAYSSSQAVGCFSQRYRWEKVATSVEILGGRKRVWIWYRAWFVRTGYFARVMLFVLDSRLWQLFIANWRLCYKSLVERTRLVGVSETGDYLG